jgi:peptidoglycan/xylan/chitin deacetylase (PgdA/CDA1 family)
MSKNISRRTLLGAAACLLAGCTTPEPRHRAAVEPTTAPSTTTSTSLSPQSSAVPTTTVQTTTTPTTPLPPATGAPAARAGVIGKYQTLRPTQFGLTVPGVINRRSDSGIALTFDGCGGPSGSGYDKALIDTLRDLGTPATLFLNARWIDANRKAFDDLAADPLFDIGNHGTRHLPLSVSGRAAYGIAGTRDAGEVFDEVAGNHAKLTALLGRPPAFFRSGTAHYDDVATKIVTDLGEQVIGFDINADAGATFSPPQVERAMAGAKPGSIVIGHLNNPRGGTARGMAAALPALLASGKRITRLRDHLR